MEQIKKHKWFIVNSFLVLSILWLTISLVLLVIDYRRLHERGHLPIGKDWHVSHVHRMLAISDVERIQPWMTYALINDMYALPSDFLRSMLRLSDSEYPDITIGATASRLGTSTLVLLNHTKESVAGYLVANSTSTPN